MKKLVKSLSVFVVLFVLAFVVVANVKAAPVLKVGGAQIRTSGNEGIRFVAELDTLEGVTERGFLVAKGEYSVEEMKEKGTKYVVSGKTYNMFSAVIYGIPEESYTQDLTVVAYYVTDGDPVYADASVTRNIAEVAVAAKNAGNTTDLVVEIDTYLKANSKKVGYDLDGNYAVTGLNTFLKSDLIALRNDFINDANNVCGINLSEDCSRTDFAAAMQGSANNTISDSNIYKVFRAESLKGKYDWLLNYFIESDLNLNVKRQAYVALSDGRVETAKEFSSTTEKLYYGEHLYDAVYCLFNQLSYEYTVINGYQLLANFEDSSEYADLADYCTVYFDDSTLYVPGDKITLPSFEKTGYTFNGWSDESNEYSENSEYTITSADVKFTAIVEKITEVIVSSTYSDKEIGSSVEYNNDTYKVGTNAFSTITEALNNVAEGVTVIVLKGTYTEDFTISKSNITLSGPNAEVAGNGKRAEEAVLNNSVITIAGDVKGTELVGLKFTGTSQVIGNKGTAGKSTSAATYTANHENFLFENNYVEVGNITGNGFIAMSVNSNQYTLNPKFLNNYFTFNSNVESTSLTSVIWMNGARNIQLNNNVFKDILTTGYYIYDNDKGLCGTNNEFNGNSFINVKGNGIDLQWISHDPKATGSKISVSNNIFENVTKYGVNFGPCNNSDEWAYSVKNNTFKGSITNAINFVRTTSSSTYDISENVFETEPTGMYFSSDFVYRNPSATGYHTYSFVVNVAENVYPENYDTTKFSTQYTKLS